MKQHAAHDLDVEDDDGSFPSSITSINSTQSNLVGNMNADSFHDAQDCMPKPDEQPDQEGKVSNFNPVEIAAHQTRLITKAVGDLVMNPEKNDNAGSTGEGDEFGNGSGSLTIDLEPDADDNDDEKQRAFDKEQDDAFNDKFPNPDTFFEYLLNEAGSNIGAIEDLVELMAERIDINEGAGIALDLMQYNISHDLHRFLESEGDT